MFVTLESTNAMFVRCGKITIMAKTLVAKNSNEGDVASVVGSGEGCNWW
jgi:hypothetical protein